MLLANMASHPQLRFKATQTPLRVLHVQTHPDVGQALLKQHHKVAHGAQHAGGVGRRILLPEVLCRLAQLLIHALLQCLNQRGSGCHVGMRVCVCSW